MRSLLPLLPVCLLLAGCPAPKPQQAPPATPATKAASEEPTGLPEVAGPLKDFVGFWATSDQQGQPYDLTLFPNGQATTNWTKGKDGAQGQRGFWRLKGKNAMVLFDDGWTLVMEDGKLAGYGPESSLDGPPAFSQPLERLPAEQTPYAGVWRLNKEPDGTFQYLVLQSSGRAFSTVNGGTEGTWKVTPKGAQCDWPDSWVDLIERSPNGWQKRSWVGTNSDAPTDLSPAERIGEERLKVQP